MKLKILFLIKGISGISKFVGKVDFGQMDFRHLKNWLMIVIPTVFNTVASSPSSSSMGIC